MLLKQMVFYTASRIGASRNFKEKGKKHKDRIPKSFRGAPASVRITEVVPIRNC
jgi:hypothetical protein